MHPENKVISSYIPFVQMPCILINSTNEISILKYNNIIYNNKLTEPRDKRRKCH